MRRATPTPDSARPVRALAIAAMLVAALLPLGRTAWATSTFVPLDHPLYHTLDAWAARGMLGADPGAIRPLTWDRVAELLDGAQPENDTDRSRLADMRAEASAHAGGSGRAELALQGAWAHGPAAAFPTVPAVANGPTLDNDGGRRIREPGGLSAELRLEKPGRRVAVSFAPRATVGHAGGGNPTWQEGYLLATAGPVNLSAGRQPFQWGPARHGGFLLTPNAAPLPALRANGARPFHLPAHLGTLNFDLFAARLEADRVVPHPILSGLRLEWRPVASLQIGLSRTTMLGGEGRPALDAGDLWTIVLGKNLYGSADTSNSIAGVDASLSLPNPFSPGHMRVYGEYAGEDEASMRPTKPAVRGGLVVPGLGTDGVIAVRAEFAATDVLYDHAKWGNNVWYAHSIYRSGYTFRGSIIGDAVGPDARDARLWITQDGKAFSELELGWRASYFSAPEREERWRMAVTRTARIGRTATLSARAATDRRVGNGPGRSGWEGLLAATISVATDVAARN